MLLKKKNIRVLGPNSKLSFDSEVTVNSTTRKTKSLNPETVQLWQNSFLPVLLLMLFYVTDQ